MKIDEEKRQEAISVILDDGDWCWVLDHYMKDTDFSFDSSRCFIDVETQEIHGVFERGQVTGSIGLVELENNKDRYFEVEGRCHEVHHEILQRFLESEWTDDEKIRGEAAAIYAVWRSIGKWKRELAECDNPAYFNYKEFERNYLASDLAAVLQMKGIYPATEDLSREEAAMREGK
ncbi:MAG: hypothetical protein WDZ51_03440 [Pirellulaceae bacterium]